VLATVATAWARLGVAAAETAALRSASEQGVLVFNPRNVTYFTL